MRADALPVIFISYDEPWADAFWEDLRAKVPHARRVHGVKGLDACHKAAARAADGPRFITVDADTIVEPGFAALEIPVDFLNDRCHLEWPSRNAVNGLVYGNGSIKCWSRQAIEHMRSHEAALAEVRSLDHDIPGVIRIVLPEIAARSFPAETPYHGFRGGFREGVRLSRPQDRRGAGRAFGTSLDPGSSERLQIWCTLGAHAPNGLWAIYGARLGLWMAQATDWDLLSINDYNWFGNFWQDIVTARFPIAAADGTDPALVEAVRLLGARIGDTLNFELADLGPEVSRLLTEAPQPNAAFSMVDAVGSLYAKGHGVGRNLARARELYEVGAILGASGAVNNLARMLHLGLGVEADPQAAVAYYEEAIAMSNAFAPYHLAGLLGEIDPDGAGMTERRDALVRMAASRGYAPDRPPSNRGGGG